MVYSVKAICKLMRIIPVSRPESKPVKFYLLSIKVKYLLSGSCKNQTDIYRERYHLLLSMVWSCLTFSKSLETIGRSETGLKSLGSLLVPFLYKGLSLATLQSFGK